MLIVDHAVPQRVVQRVLDCRRVEAGRRGLVHVAAGLKPDGEAFYFVHSYYCVPADPKLVLAESDYGGPFCAALARGRCFATQFHPEKSQAKGLQVYRNFAALAAPGR